VWSYTRFLIVFRILFFFESCKRLHFSLFYFLVEYLFFEFMQKKILYYSKGKKIQVKMKKKRVTALSLMGHLPYAIVLKTRIWHCDSFCDYDLKKAV